MFTSRGPTRGDHVACDLWPLESVIMLCPIQTCNSCWLRFWICKCWKKRIATIISGLECLDIIKFQNIDRNFFLRIRNRIRRRKVWDVSRPLPDPTCTDRRNEVMWLVLCGEHAKQSDVLLCIIYFVLKTDQATNKQNLIKTDLVAMVFIHLSHRKQ